eukprot:GEMP01009981.1.p1 GENE.GEMP01009981.1~~GEMP01009981.1.p1  ORF type:complete len:667 (+),score=174.90 GEMP01009981.1:256-2256(+)
MNRPLLENPSLLMMVAAGNRTRHHPKRKHKLLADVTESAHPGAAATALAEGSGTGGVDNSNNEEDVNGDVGKAQDVPDRDGELARTQLIGRASMGVSGGGSTQRAESVSGSGSAGDDGAEADTVGVSSACSSNAELKADAELEMELELELEVQLEFRAEVEAELEARRRGILPPEKVEAKFSGGGGNATHNGRPDLESEVETGSNGRGGKADHKRRHDLEVEVETGSNGKGGKIVCERRPYIEGEAGIKGAHARHPEKEQTGECSANASTLTPRAPTDSLSPGDTGHHAASLIMVDTMGASAVEKVDAVTMTDPIPGSPILRRPDIAPRAKAGPVRPMPKVKDRPRRIYSERLPRTPSVEAFAGETQACREARERCAMRLLSVPVYQKVLLEAEQEQLGEHEWRQQVLQERREVRGLSPKARLVGEVKLFEKWHDEEVVEAQNEYVQERRRERARHWRNEVFPPTRAMQYVRSECQRVKTESHRRQLVVIERKRRQLEYQAPAPFVEPRKPAELAESSPRASWSPRHGDLQKERTKANNYLSQRWKNREAALSADPSPERVTVVKLKKAEREEPILALPPISLPRRLAEREKANQYLAARREGMEKRKQRAEERKAHESACTVAHSARGRLEMSGEDRLLFDASRARLKQLNTFAEWRSKQVSANR